VQVLAGACRGEGRRLPVVSSVPWAALEGGVLMQQEIGHGESCSSVSNALPFSQNFADGSSYADPNVFQTCNGGNEGKKATGEGPCNPSTAICQNATTQGVNGPVACPRNDASSGALCEFSDGRCFQQEPHGNDQWGENEGNRARGLL
jgi:hypothetical protein